MHLDSHSLGWRLRVLRLRREMTLAELARLSGLEISYLSRLERDVLQNAKPKPETVDRILDAVEASLDEREAVYHMEHPPLHRSDIDAQIGLLFEQQETFPEPVVIRDEHWNAWYYNLSARAAFGLDAKEYRRVLGTNIMLELIDPAIPVYSRCSEEERQTAFSIKVAMFKTHFANQEFDQWYLDVVNRVYDFAWAAKLWERPILPAVPLTLEAHDLNVANPFVGRLRFRLQLNRLLLNPRFLLVGYTPLDKDTTRQLKELRARPESSYEVASIHGVKKDSASNGYPRQRNKEQLREIRA
jgi:transcriptional regulator with XRE-family HTH domain